MELDAVSSLSGNIAAHLFTTTGVLISIFLVLVTTLILYFHGSLLSGPGPWGVPIFGYYPFLKKNMHIQLRELAKTYGHVYKFNICGKTFVYMDSIEAIRESHITKSDDFPHRIDKPGLFTEVFDQGIFIVKGEHWKILRKFVHQGMREIGLSANNDELKDLIVDSIKNTLDCLSESKGKPLDITSLLVKEATRIVSRPYLGENVSEEDSQILYDSYCDTFLPFEDRSVLLYGNFARYFVVPWIHGYAQFQKGVAETNRVLYKIVNEHKSVFVPDDQPTNFIDIFLKEKMSREKKGDSSAKYFTDHCLVATLAQTYGDGAAGVGLFLASYLYELSKLRSVQDAIYEEIIKVIGSERLPILSDRSDLPYTNSAIKELFRTLILFPILPGLECVRDTTVQGVHVPKGSIVVLNYWAVHNDPDLYENPAKFDATRYLPDKTKTEPPITFGIGKRSCAGEGVVMAEVFLFLTSILQNFTLVSEADQEGSFHNTAEGKCFVRAIPRPKGMYGSMTSS